MSDTVSLKEHFDTRFAEFDRRFVAEESKTKLAKENIELRFKELNEIRAMTSDWSERFADKSEVDAKIDRVLTKLEGVEKELGTKIVTLEKYVSSLKGVIWVLGGVAIFAGFIVPILMKYLPVLIMRGP